jgi:hypothetical protein
MVVLNSSYFNFGKVFINSLYKNINLSNLNKLYIVDIGLTDDDKDFFNNYDKVKIYDTELKTDFNDGGTWGKGWQISVGAKTIMFKHILEQTDLPLVMIDGDCIFVKDFEELIDDNYDIQACKRSNHSVPYLASFVIAQNNTKSIDFINSWIDIMSNKLSKQWVRRALVQFRQESDFLTYKDSYKQLSVPRESPSLGEAVNLVGDKLNFGSIDRIKVSTYNENEFCDDTYIIHLKGSSLSRDITERELKSLVSNTYFSNLIEEYMN